MGAATFGRFYIHFCTRDTNNIGTFFIRLRNRNRSVVCFLSSVVRLLGGSLRHSHSKPFVEYVCVCVCWNVLHFSGYDCQSARLWLPWSRFSTRNGIGTFPYARRLAACIFPSVRRRHRGRSNILYGAVWQ